MLIIFQHRFLTLREPTVGLSERMGASSKSLRKYTLKMGLFVGSGSLIQIGGKFHLR